MKTAEISDREAAMMSSADRKALDIRLPCEREALMEAISEKELQRICEQELSRRNIVYLHLSPKAREKAGWPDLTFSINGTPMAIELKTATGKLSEEQIYIMTRMAKNGWHTEVVRSFEQFVNILKS